MCNSHDIVVNHRTSFEVTVVCDRIYVAKNGTQVIIPYREEDEKRHLKVTGDLGQVVALVGLLSLA
jgi:NADH dehydrogenase (ubiquinone) 1 alpha subcomplex subunit 9